VIVVVDTSVVLNLCCVRREHLLASLFGRVLVPMEVAGELRACEFRTPRHVNVDLHDRLEVDEVERGLVFNRTHHHWLIDVELSLQPPSQLRNMP